ncbi:MAG: cysteine desulfurase [Patescibacteria group bacterium]|nr:cysteine desulfurase [Patescibacteria group bacterium]
MKRIYLDNASITPTRKEVLKEMVKYYGYEYGNPSSIHTEGVNAKKALEEAKKSLAFSINAHSDEIIFTSNGTEANNLAILGMKLEGKHAITSTIEHSSVLRVFKELEKRGLSVTYVNVDENGIIDLKELKDSLKKETVLISIMLVNNEIGTIQPISEIAHIIRKSGLSILFHTDASQALLYLDINIDKLGVDMLSMDGHKVYGPKGIGALYIKRRTIMEKELKLGTENLPAVKGFVKAVELAKNEQQKEVTRLCELRDYCIQKLEKECGAKLNGDRKKRIANNINISISNIDTEFLTLQLDAEGIAVSTKSSCLKDENESYVLKAIGNSNPKNAIRITLGRDTTKKNIDKLVKVVKKHV